MHNILYLELVMTSMLYVGRCPLVPTYVSRYDIKILDYNSFILLSYEF